MASTNYSKGTVIKAEWLNEVDSVVHDVFGAATTKATARTNLSVPGLNTANTFTENQEIQSTDDTATAGPDINLYRDSASPADNDELGQVKYDGNSDNGTRRTYAALRGKIIDPSDGAEDGDLRILRMSGGSLTDIGSVLAGPATSSDPSLAFDTWRTPNADRPTLVAISLLAQTNGTTAGDIRIDINDSGGTTVDYNLRACFADDTGGGGFASRSAFSFYVPAGGSYRVNNNQNPNSINAIESHQEFTL